MTFKSGHVAFVGEPNVGKSTLLNALIGEHIAIVTPKPQTTRHRIVGILNREKSQIVLLDTPGYHLSEKPLNQVMLRVVDHTIADADFICLMVEPSTIEHEINHRLFQRIGNERCIVVINKGDVIARAECEGLAQRIKGWGAREVLVISAREGIGMGELVSALEERLPEGPPLYPRDLHTEQSLRFLASELIREQVFLQMHQEIPYAAEVQIEEFREAQSSDDTTHIKASILLEKEGQKGMLIGKGGARIKEIGSKARARIEELVGGKVFLELFVRIEKDWTKDRRKLQDLGYA